MKTVLRSLLSLMAICAVQMGMANNIQVNNIALVNQNTTAGLNNTANHTFVQFDLTWDNSWRISAGPANYDAAWIFVKFQVFGSPEWQHATLSSTDAHHTIANNNGTAMTIDAAANGRGVIVHRTNNGTGNINLTGVQLRWNYRSGNVVHDTANVTVRVFAIEMVFIPQGEFFIGDGTLTTPAPSTNAFRINNVGNNRPYKVVSEGAIAFLNGSTAGGGTNQLYDPYMPIASNLPAGFPKGFAAFYVMKYELSVKQYTDFFNTLRTDITTAKNNRTLQSGQVSRNTFFWNGSPLTDATTGATSGDRAQGNLSNMDVWTYADWAGIRPMTELEFEKAARGCDRTGASPGVAIYPVNGEYAWGTTSITTITSAPTTGDGTATESISTSATQNANTGFSSGPVRCGMFAAKNPVSNQRVLTGGSYYGVMEMTGNLEEWLYGAFNQTDYTAYSATGNIFLGTHGDGNINSSTGENNTFINVNYRRMTLKGGAYNGARRISERINTATTTWSYSSSSPSATARYATSGFRGAISGNQF